MPNKTRPYREALLEALSDPIEAVHYLNAAIGDSPEMFLKALRNVAQARQMAKVARDAGVTRESLYRATSEIGNPTLDTLNSVLSAMGIKLKFEPDADVSPAVPIAGVPSSLTPTEASVPVELGSSIQGIGASAGYFLIGAGASFRANLAIAGWEQNTATAQLSNRWNSSPPLADNYDQFLNIETANTAGVIPAGFAAELQTATTQY